jgi:antitoxin component YwqK of YwqJK toxin-antitoxin module
MHWTCCFRSLAVVAAVALLGGQAFAQDSDDDTSVEIKPYTGPPIYLDEPEPQPDATLVEKVVDSAKYSNDKVRMERQIARYSDNRLESDGFYREFYPDGSKFAEGQYVKGRQHGEWTYWHKSGEVARTVNYKNGQPDGSWEVFRDDGTLSAQRSYKGGKRDGTWVVFDDTGKKPTREESYKDGLADGTWKVWFPDGKLQTEVNFKEGKRHGPMQVWDDEGVKRADLTYQDNLLEGTATVVGADGKTVVQQYEKGKLVSEKK